MSEDQEEYVTEAMEMIGKGYEKAAVIERPRKTHAIGNKGLEEYQLYGWVKMSARFCAHIKNLRGAKLAIWLCLALSIDEDGECKLSQKELCSLTGYSHTEVIESVKELDEMGFLSVDRSGKKNLYSPVFVAKGKGNSPSKETLVKKLDSTPLDSNESSPPSQNSVPTSIKKEQDIKQILSNSSMDWSILAGQAVTQSQVDKQSIEAEATNAFEFAFGITRPWNWYADERTWKDFRRWVVEKYKADKECFRRYVTWRGGDGQYKGAMNNVAIKRQPELFPDSWDMFKNDDIKAQQDRKEGVSSGYYG